MCRILNRKNASLEESEAFISGKLHDVKEIFQGPKC